MPDKREYGDDEENHGPVQNLNEFFFVDVCEKG